LREGVREGDEKRGEETRGDFFRSSKKRRKSAAHTHFHIDMSRSCVSFVSRLCGGEKNVHKRNETIRLFKSCLETWKETVLLSDSV
jgi:hypothetical protein